MVLFNLSNSTFINFLGYHVDGLVYTFSIAPLTFSRSKGLIVRHIEFPSMYKTSRTNDS